MTTDIEPAYQNGKLSTIAQDARAALMEYQRLAREGLTSMLCAGKKGLIFGEIMLCAHEFIEHGDWGKWLSDNFRDVHPRTLYKWMNRAKFARKAKLTDKQILKICIESEEKEKRNGIGTHEVVIYDSFLLKVGKPAKKTLGMLRRANVLEWPEEEKEKLRESLAPMRELVEQLWPNPNDEPPLNYDPGVSYSGVVIDEVKV